MKPLSEIKSQKKDLLKSFVLVVILSSGISLIVNSIINNADSLVSLILGVLLVLVVAVFYFKEYVGCSSCEVSVDTVMTVDNENRIIPIPRFGFSEDLERATISVFAENRVYEKLWKDAFVFGDVKASKGKKFVIEFLQYLFIKKLALNLNSYFVGMSDKTIEVIGREQIPDILLKNRVIEMITKPYEERELFQKAINNVDSSPKNGTVVYMNGEDGALYDMLEIELPRNSIIMYDGDTLVVKNRNYTIRFDACFDGFCTNTRPYFEHFYLGRSLFECHNYKVDLKLSIRFSPLFLLSFRDWRYLGWLDQIGDSFIEYFSFDDFITRIGYEEAATSRIVLSNGKNKKKESDPDRNSRVPETVQIVKMEEKD